MKYIIIILLILSFSLFAIQKDNYTNYIHFNKPNIQLGEILQNQTIPFSFFYTNISKSLIELQFKSTCGCTVVKNSGTKIAPKRLGKLEGHFFSKSYDGPITKYIYVIDSQNRFLYKYPIRATVYPDFYVSQKNIFIPSLHKNKKKFTINLASKKFPTFKIKKIHYNQNFFHLTYKQTKKGYRITISIKEIALSNVPNYFKEKISIETIPKSDKEISFIIHGYR